MDESLDLTRNWFLDCDRSGIITIRRRGQDVFVPQGLPVFSTDTLEEACAIRATHCRRLRGDMIYVLIKPPVNLRDLKRVSDAFRKTYELLTTPDRVS